MRSIRTGGLVGIAVMLSAAIVAAGRATAPPAEPRPAAGTSAVPAAPGDRAHDPALPASSSASEPESSPAAEAAPVRAPVPATGLEAAQMAFAWPATDVPVLLERVGTIGAAVDALGSAADSYSIPAMKEAAREVATLATGLETYAAAAHSRLAPLSPGDPILNQAWSAALEAYTRVRAHASAAMDIAEFALTLDPAKATAAMDSVGALGGREVDLLQALASVQDLLEGWSSAHGAEARAAVARFGVPAA